MLFGWDGDHLHVFESGKKRYGDPFVNLEGTGDEEAVRVRDAMTAAATIACTYDLGACWERSLAAAMLEAGLEEIDEGDAISAIDRFALQYRLPDGQTVVDRFVARH